MPETPPRATSRRAVSWTVLVTLLLIGTELLLLRWVYSRADPVRQQRVAASFASGELAVTGDPTGTVQAAQILAQLRTAGLDAAHVRQVEALLPPDAAAVPTGTARAAIAQVRARIGRQLHTMDNEALGIYALLLVLASLGWAVWFRRLVARHRALQRELTEQQAQAYGERRLAALLRNAADLTVVCDAELAIVSATPAAQRLLGRSADEMLGTTVVDYVVPEDAELFEAFVYGRRLGAEDVVAVRMPHVDGRIRRTEVTLADLTGDPAVGGVVLTVRDVSARWALEQQLSHDALHDALTGIGNRRLFGDRLAHALSRSERVDVAHTVLYLDLDEFKAVNDLHGHAVGDRVLALIAGRMSSLCRVGDTVARIGGDEFALLLENTSAMDAEQLARRLLAQVTAPLEVDESTVSVRASIGLAAAVPGEGDAETVLRNADVAMYSAKRRGPGHVAHYEERLHARELERLQLRSELERGIAADELVVHYQPITSLETGRLMGLEALVRWQHPTRGLLPPVAFVPLAEESGLIGALGSWVLRRAAEESADLAGNPAPIRISVNVAAQQLADASFVDEVIGVLARTGLAPGRLCLEITESSLMHDLDDVRAVLSQLRSVGVQVAVDDFGTGYSSLSYLANLPIDILKVDKSFLDRVTTDAREAQLAEAIIALGRTLGMATTAEGVELGEQATWLRSVGCSYGQGYLWSRPVPMAAIRELIEAEQRGALAPSLVAALAEPLAG